MPNYFLYKTSTYTWSAVGVVEGMGGSVDEGVGSDAGFWELAMK